MAHFGAKMFLGTSPYEWDKTKASQMRNGALSRMEELCLIVREKKGREVTYSLTDLCRVTVLAD